MFTGSISFLVIGAAMADGAPPSVAPRAPVKIAPAAVPPATLRSVLDREQARLAPKLTLDLRAKLQVAARRVSTAMGADLAANKPVDAADVPVLARKTLGEAGIDLAGLPIEDAVTWMMMVLSEDAKQDLRSSLAEMDATRKRKAALREGAERMKQESAEAAAAARASLARKRLAALDGAFVVHLQIAPPATPADAGAPR